MRRARNEEGFAVVTAILLLTVILGLGLGLLQFADAQQKASTREQASEAAFNVAEAALSAQVGQLSRAWPTSATAFPEKHCTSNETYNASTDCPSPTDLKLDPNTGSTACSGADAWESSLSNRWTTYVREDVGASSLFNSTQEQSAPSYASSDSGALWVRSVGVVQCHPVAVITLVTRQRVSLEFLEDAIAGNWFEVTNSGNKVIVDRKGDASQAAPVSMRCDPLPPGGKCEQYNAGSTHPPRVSQVSPPIANENPPTSTTTLTASQLETIKSEAQAHGTFYSPTNCPTSMQQLAGVQLPTEGVLLPTSPRAPVYIEGCGAVNIQANGTANCESPTPAASPPNPASPGFLVLANGTFELSGKSIYCGVIYAANLENLSGPVVKLQGGTVVVGGIVVDGAGGIDFGSSGQGGNPANLVFDPLAIHNATISAGAAATRNSFRVLPSGQ